MGQIDLDSVDEDPVEYWTDHREEITSALQSSNRETLQRGSYAFVMAAKAGVVQELSPSVASAVRNRVRENDIGTRVNTIGGIGGTLLSGTEQTRRLLMDSSLVSDLTAAATTVERDLSENALLALSLVALEWPSSLTEHPTAVETCVEKVASAGQRATYAALSLANVAYIDADALAPYFPKFRMAIDPSADGRQLAALTYCLGQTVSHQELTDAGVDATMQAIDQSCRFVIETDPSPALQAFVIESLVPLVQELTHAVRGTEVPELVESVLSWGNSTGLYTDETAPEEQTPLPVAEAAIRLAVALPQSELDLDGQFLLTVEGATDDPTIEDAAEKLRKQSGPLTIESVFKQIVVEIEHLDELISVDIDDSRNININSPGAVNRYYE
jgi:hypothetical protein